MEPCKFEERIINMCENVAKISNDIEHVLDHIKSSVKYRMMIIVSCISLVGVILGGIVRFSVVEYKVAVLQNAQGKMQDQIFDLNYIKGKTEGIAEAAK